MPSLGKGAKGAAVVVVDEHAVYEHRRKQEILLRTRLQELLEEEQSMSKSSALDIQCRWMEWLRKQKKQELTAEIEIIRHMFEKTLDRKNAVIAMLSLDMGEAEEQYRLALRTHLANIDALIDLQSRRMTDLDVQFENDLLELRGDFELERAEIARKHELEKADLKLILENMMAEAEREDRKLQEETSESHETATEKMEEEQKQMQGELSKLNESLRYQINERFDEFVNNATVNMKEYMELTKTDEDTAEKIGSQMRRIQKLQESIGTWKSNLSNNIRECEERNNAMKAEKETTARHFKDLKARMQRWRREEERRLAELVSDARTAEQALEKKAASAERILRLVELCQPLETEREKVLGFDSDVAADEVLRDVKGHMAASAASAAAAVSGPLSGGAAMAEGMSALFSGSSGTETAQAGAGASDEWKLLERFWVKHNKVVLDNAAIAQERFHLQHENEKLRSLLKQYLDGVSVNNDVMSQKNNLLQTGRFRTLAASTGSKRGTAGMTVVEGNKIVAEVARQRNY